jgi:ethanolamine ammonia-lyase small subunit
MASSGDELRPRPGPPDDDPWSGLRRYTPARIGLGRSGVSLPTRHHLQFQLAHALARDAVHGALDVDATIEELAALGYGVVPLHSAATTREEYLRNPNLGRRLDPSSAALLRARSTSPDEHDAVFIVADGLSAPAVQRHAAGVLGVILPTLHAEGWRLAPLTLVEQGRVAISDEIGEIVGARQAIVLLGERPGLSAPASLGIYLTYQPRVGNTDADRNCISNVRDGGTSYREAALRLLYLMREARRIGRSGVMLKDESSTTDAIEHGNGYSEGTQN